MHSRSAQQTADRKTRSRAPVLSRADLWREVERQQREIERLREQVIERDRQITDHEKQIVELDRQIADAEKQISDLERQLASRRKNSTNSSKPPSTDGAAGNTRPPVQTRRKKSKRKQGAQKGHPGHHRPLVPVAQVKEVRHILPAACKHCSEPLPQEQIRTVGEVHRHNAL